MRPGRRNKKIEIQSPVEKENTYGEKEILWVEYTRIWAKATPARGKEYFSALQTNNKNIMMFTINYREDVTDKFRVVYKHRNFEINNVINVEERNVDLELMCSEIT